LEESRKGGKKIKKNLRKVNGGKTKRDKKKKQEKGRKRKN